MIHILISHQLELNPFAAGTRGKSLWGRPCALWDLGICRSGVNVWVLAATFDALIFLQFRRLCFPGFATRSFFIYSFIYSCSDNVICYMFFSPPFRDNSHCVATGTRRLTIPQMRIKEANCSASLSWNDVSVCFSSCGNKRGLLQHTFKDWREGLPHRVLTLYRYVATKHFPLSWLSQFAL